MIEKITLFFEEHNIIVRGLALVLGAFICGFVYNVFTVPNNIVYGGLGGLAIVVNNFSCVSPVVFLNIAVGISLILSIFMLGFKHTLHSLIGYGMFILMVDLTGPLTSNINISFDSFFFSCVFFGLLIGIGSGLIYRSGFDTAGIDTILTILRDKFKVPFGTVGNIVNGLIILSGVISFGYIKAIYAIITLVIINFISDAVVIGLSSKKMVFINSKKTNDLVKFIQDDLASGYTLLQSTNGIGIFKRTIIMCVIPTYRFYTLKAKVKSIDDQATLYSHDCYNVAGGTTNQIVMF
jgi:uncharacterized membrane-anchored protein YitT (DUF2179 family)